MADRTTVVNINHRVPFDVYIGRAGRGYSGIFGNPHIVGKPCRLCPGVTHQRGEAVDAFRKYFYEKIASDAVFKQQVSTLKNKTLGCFCKPNKCHGDVIAEWLDSIY